MSDEEFTQVGANIAEKATMIWNVAYLLRGPFKPHEYVIVILPMTIVKRFQSSLYGYNLTSLKRFQLKSDTNDETIYSKKMILYLYSIINIIIRPTDSTDNTLMWCIVYADF